MANDTEKRKDFLKPVAEWILGRKGFFTLDQLVRETGLNRMNVRVVLNRLCKEKLVNRYVKEGWYEARCRRGEVVPQAYFLLADKKGLAARLAPKQKTGTAAERMWKVIRYKKFFTRRDLVILGEATKDNAKCFTKALRRQGIIEPSRDGGSGVEWRLVKDVGAKRPYIPQKKKGETAEGRREQVKALSGENAEHAEDDK